MILLIGPQGTNFNEILLEIHTFSFKKSIWSCRLEMTAILFRSQCVKGKGNPAFICRTIEYIHQWYMVVIHASFIYQEGKTEWVPKIWESSAHGGHHIASLLRKTDVDVMQCGQQPAWWLITPSPIPEAARCQLLLRTGQLRYLNASARKLPPKLQCQEMINIT